jgi:predicted metal-dependent hydrolase
LFKIFPININDTTYDVKIAKVKRCCKFILKANFKTKQPQISIPYSVSYDAGLKFFLDNHEWFLKQIESNSAPLDFANLSTISIYGEIYNIVDIIDKKNRFLMNRESKEIQLFMKDSTYKSAILIKFLKQEALSMFTELSFKQAKIMNITFNKIAVNDSISKWGSCSATKNLKYNFRLIMAPVFVIEYIVIHELAHIKEFNHSPQFWQLVNDLCPNFKVAQQWLKEHGKCLY